MKKCILLLFVLCQITCSYGQENEFQIHSNGLIYDEATMHRLGVIVDSLNIKFRSCDLAHPYYSFPQGFAHFINVDSKEARAQIRQGISLDEYLRKYGNRSAQKKVWIVKSTYTYDKDKRIEYSGLPSDSNEDDITVNYSKKNDVEAVFWNE